MIKLNKKRINMPKYVKEVYGYVEKNDNNDLRDCYYYSRDCTF